MVSLEFFSSISFAVLQQNKEIFCSCLVRTQYAECVLMSIRPRGKTHLEFVDLFSRIFLRNWLKKFRFTKYLLQRCNVVMIANSVSFITRQRADQNDGK